MICTSHSTFAILTEREAEKTGRRSNKFRVHIIIYINSPILMWRLGDPQHEVEVGVKVCMGSKANTYDHIRFYLSMAFS